MGWKVDSNGITIKKLFNKKTIPYRALKSIVIDDENIIFTTKEGEALTQKNENYDGVTELYEAIKKYNISYRNENELGTCSATYTIDKVHEKAAIIKDYIYGLMSGPVKAEYGDQYDVSFDIGEEDEYVSLHFGLTKSGYLVAEFEDMILAYLVEWDSLSDYGKYGVTVEVEDKKACESLVQGILNDLILAPHKLIDPKIFEK